MECSPPRGIVVEVETDMASGRVRCKDERELRGGSDKAGPTVSETRERANERRLHYAAKLSGRAR